MPHPTDSTEHCAKQVGHQENPQQKLHQGFRYSFTRGQMQPPPEWADKDYR
ncbi:hypothetical protein [Streptomyces sp. NPDC002644]